MLLSRECTHATQNKDVDSHSKLNGRNIIWGFSIAKSIWQKNLLIIVQVISMRKQMWTRRKRTGRELLVDVRFRSALKYSSHVQSAGNKWLDLSAFDKAQRAMDSVLPSFLF